jgi:hypothetical protein
MSENDPLHQLVETLKALENPDRALCLIAVYLGQRADQNTIQGITDLYTVLIGKGKTATPAKIRGLITTLVKNRLLERERERMISKTKVSFHQISPLGEIALLYVSLFLINSPAELDLDKLQFMSYMAGDSEFKLARYLINSALKENPQTNRILTFLREGKDPDKIRAGKPTNINIPKIFSGKSGYNTFKILEELIWDYLHNDISISRVEMDNHFDTPIGSNLNRLTPFMNEQTLGKAKYYRISTLGIFILPVFALLIKQFSLDTTILPTLLTTDVDSDKNAWFLLIEQAKAFFRALYNLSY